MKIFRKKWISKFEKPKIPSEKKEFQSKYSEEKTQDLNYELRNNPKFWKDEDLEELIDLRGLCIMQVNKKMNFGRSIYRKMILKNLDLSYGTIQQVNVSIENCKVNFIDVRDDSVEIPLINIKKSECIGIKGESIQAKIENSNLSYLKIDRYIQLNANNVTFNNSDFSRKEDSLNNFEGRYENCSFLNVNFNGVAFTKGFFLLFLTVFSTKSFSQKLVEYYEPVQNDSLRVGIGENDFLPFIQKGYTLMLPENKEIKGVLIFHEDSKYDKKNRSSKQMYSQASEKGFAVLSVSTEIPLDFYFSKSSMISSHKIIREVFDTYNIPNENIFFLGASIVGHRAMRYIKYMKEGDFEFQLQIKGIVPYNFTMDFTRKWHQHKRDIRINQIDLWEPKFINYLLETNLEGTPKTNPENYHNFSSYSYSDEKNENINLYKDYRVRAYIEPAIEYKLTKQLRTLYDNNSTDIIGFLAELRIAGNENTELIILQTEDNKSQNKNTQSTWD